MEGGAGGVEFGDEGGAAGAEGGLDAVDSQESIVGVAGEIGVAGRVERDAGADGVGGGEERGVGEDRIDDERFRFVVGREGKADGVIGVGLVVAAYLRCALIDDGAKARGAED